MDIIEQVVATEKEQEQLLSTTEAQLQEKLAAKQEELEAKFLKNKDKLLASHEKELKELEKRFARRKVKSPEYALSAKQKKEVIAAILSKLKWQLKK
mgnify:CR=1 FL=1